MKHSYQYCKTLLVKFKAMLGAVTRTMSIRTAKAMLGARPRRDKAMLGFCLWRDKMFFYVYI
ncbi:MAG: hypothetical protein KKD35_07195 [Elusimicrobia bacterium]|nr:hypothetical protein [Elusimicrobiota bacterium]